MQDEQCGQCGRAVAAHETPCILDEAVVCRECHDRARPVCPYCFVDLESRPVSRSKCPGCNGRILLRTAQRVYPSIYLTEPQAKEVDRYKASTPATYGASSADFAVKKRQLARDLGRDPTPQEIIDAVNDDVPATQAQIGYAVGVGIPLPPDARKNGTSLCLYVYSEYKADIEDLWSELVSRVSAPTDAALGALVAEIAGDHEILRMHQARRRGEFIDVLYSAAGRRRVKELARQCWSDRILD